MGLFRRRSSQPDDPITDLDRSVVPPRLVGVVDDAVAANDRWRQLVSALREGPLAARMVAIGERVEQGVLEIHATAARVGEIERVLSVLDPENATAEFKRAKRGMSTGGAGPAEFDAIRERFESTQRLLNLVDDAEARLRVLDARLAAAVARGAEVALTASDDGLGVLDSDLVSVLDELTALRAGLDAVR